MTKKNQKHFHDLVTKISQKLFTKSPLKIAKLKSDTNIVFLVIYSTYEEYIIRFSPPDKPFNYYEKEAWIYTRCRQESIPTPEVIALDTSCQEIPHPYMVLKKLPGNPVEVNLLTKREKLSLWHQFGEILSKIHSIKIQGYGDLVRSGITFQGEAKDLKEWLSVEFSTSWWVTTIKKYHLYDIKKITNTKKIVIDKTNYVSGLTHGDPLLRNIVVNDATITGIFDMEFAKIGNPEMDFRIYRFWNLGEDLALLMKGYSNSRYDSFLNTPILEYHYALQSLAYFFIRKDLKRASFAFSKAILLETQL